MAHKFLSTTTADTLEPDARFCTCCRKPLKGGVVFLEMDQRVHSSYHDFDDVPTDRSQGWFPFGRTCAAKLVEAERARRAETVRREGPAAR